MIDISIISKKEFDALTYRERLDVYQAMNKDSFICYRNKDNGFTIYYANGYEELSQIFSYFSQEKIVEYFYVKPTNENESLELINWMFFSEAPKYNLSFNGFEYLKKKAIEAVRTSSFPDETLVELKESVFLEYQRFRDYTVQQNKLYQLDETAMLFIKYGINAHRNSIEKIEPLSIDFVNKISKCNLTNYNGFSFLGYEFAFSKYLEGYYFSKYYKYLKDGQLDTEFNNTPSPEDEKPEFKNEFNGITDYSEIRKHFVELTTNRSSINKEPFLTDLQLDTFIQSAFMDKKIKEKIRINYNASTQTRIIRKIFYKFYNHCITKNIEPAKGTKSEYVKLLSEYFEGFDFEKTFNNWNK